MRIVWKDSKPARSTKEPKPLLEKQKPKKTG